MIVINSRRNLKVGDRRKGLMVPNGEDGLTFDRDVPYVIMGKATRKDYLSCCAEYGCTVENGRIRIERMFRKRFYFASVD